MIDSSLSCEEIPDTLGISVEHWETPSANATERVSLPATGHDAFGNPKRPNLEQLLVAICISAR